MSLGLGSCIGLALLDRRLAVAGFAHVVLPARRARRRTRKWKFADQAVPELISPMVKLGARRPMLEAVLVGGASMFAVSKSSLEVGQRNDAAVRDLLRAERINVIATETGGSRGRTIRVYVGPHKVTVREAGGTEKALVPGAERTAA